MAEVLDVTGGYGGEVTVFPVPGRGPERVRRAGDMVSAETPARPR